MLVSHFRPHPSPLPSTGEGTGTGANAMAIDLINTVTAVRFFWLDARFSLPPFPVPSPEYRRGDGNGRKVSSKESSIWNPYGCDGTVLLQLR